MSIQTEKIKRNTPSISLNDLANELKIKPDELLQRCMELGIYCSLYSPMELDDVEFLRKEYIKRKELTDFLMWMYNQEEFIIADTDIDVMIDFYIKSVNS